ncbi:MAG: hypothetical protein HQL70_01950 [Magnetococcales bacterium]|nr:hypothetical protein [Magnetococcales bacterium]
MIFRYFALGLSFFVAGMIFLLPFSAHSQGGEVVEYVGSNGAINWTSGMVVVESTSDESGSRYKACLASKVTAQRSLVEVIGQVRVDSESTVQEGVLTQDLIRSTVSGKLRGGRVLSRVVNSDGTCTVKMSVALAGPLAKAIFQQKAINKKTGKNRQHSSVENFEKSMALVENAIEPLKKEIAQLKERMALIEQILNHKPDLVKKLDQEHAVDLPTGLVVDVRGRNFIPSMSPKLRDEGGRVVFPVEPGGSQLLSLFMNDLSVAQNHPRVGGRPLIVKALNAWQDSRTEIVLDVASIKKIADLVKGKGAGNFPLIIVLD